APPQKKDPLMQQKLVLSQQILAGLAREDYGSISKAAVNLKGLTQLERWFRAQDDRYRAQLNIFWFATNELGRLAEEKNVDGAALAYTQLTLSCVNCHRIIREQPQ